MLRHTQVPLTVMGPSGNDRARQTKGGTRIYYINTVCFSSPTSPSVRAIFLWKLWPLQHIKPKRSRTSTTCNQSKDGASLPQTQFLARTPVCLAPCYTARVTPTAGHEGGGLWPSPPNSVAPQLHIIPLAPMPQQETPAAAPSSCLGMDREVGELEGEKEHLRREGMRKVAWGKQGAII